ncbi:MAG TPA: hypothetical protein VK550_27135 [Polyangiaceae bacterium]|nr:hypothetical protein [Polyangiaceae bacterium]
MRTTIDAKARSGSSRWVKAFAIATASCLTFVAVARPALAQDVAGAANAFSRAQKAELSGDHDTAAELYELADSLAPAPEALRSALRARKAAGQLASAAAHAERLLHRYPEDKRSKDLAEATLEESKRKLARVEVQCRPRACGLVVDGGAGSAEVSDVHVVYVDPGKHEVNAAFGPDRATPKVAVVKAGDRTSFTFEAPAANSSGPRMTDSGGKAGIGNASVDAGADRGTKANHRGLSPWIFATGAVVTAGLGAVTLWSGLDVLSAHDAYEGKETQRSYEDGLDKEKRTNALIGATIVAGAATGVIAVFTRWSGSSDSAGVSPARVRAGGVPLPGGAAVTIGGNF